MSNGRCAAIDAGEHVQAGAGLAGAAIILVRSILDCTLGRRRVGADVANLGDAFNGTP